MAAIAFDSAHTKTPVKGNVGNLIVQLPGTLPGPRRLLMAHMDTVPVCLGAKPVVAGKFVKSADPKTGLGGDDRAGVAVVLATAVQILKSKLPHPPLTLMFGIQEEIGLYGARFVKAADLGRPKLAFNFDGGGVEKITVGATGGYRLDISIEGIPSHAGVAPEKGVSAIAIASLAIASLVENGWHGLVEKEGKRGTSNVGVIHAGSATNVVAASATLRAEARGHANAPLSASACRRLGPSIKSVTRNTFWSSSPKSRTCNRPGCGTCCVRASSRNRARTASQCGCSSRFRMRMATGTPMARWVPR